MEQTAVDYENRGAIKTNTWLAGISEKGSKNDKTNMLHDVSYLRMKRVHTFESNELLLDM